MRSNWTVSTYFVYIIYFCFLIIPHKSLQLYFVCPLCIPFPHVPFHGLNLIELKGISTQNLLTRALWLQDFFFKSMIFLIRNFSQNWLIPNKIYFVIDLLYLLNTLLSKMFKCSWHCKKEPLLIKIPEIFNYEINFRNQNFSIAISVWPKKKEKKRKRKKLKWLRIVERFEK